MVFTQLLANSLIAGSIYALVACGFSLIYNTNKFMHLAHGTNVAFGAYLLYWLFSLLGVPFFISVILTIIFSGILGVGIYRFIYLPLQKNNASNVILLIASIGILLLFENLILLIFGANVKSIGYIEVTKGLEIFGAIITPLQLWIMFISIVLLVGLYLFMKKTKLGKNMRAASDNPELASIVGINQKRLATYSFMVGSMLAGVAGILIGLEQNLEPTMGTMLVIKGFTGSVVGGITSIPGSIAGSYLLGIAENFGIWWLPSGYKDAIGFVLLFIFLLFRPQGLFGLNKGVRK